VLGELGLTDAEIGGLMADGVARDARDARPDADPASEGEPQ
jgi:hypothetical protein